MSWKDEIKKEKYQGPQQEGGRFVGLHRHLMKMERVVGFLEQEINDSDEISKVMIEQHVKELRKSIDTLDKELIEVAKYGGSSANLSVDRQDSKNISNYGAKYRYQDGI